MVRNWSAFVVLILVAALSGAGRSPIPQQIPTPKDNLVSKTSVARSVTAQAKAAALLIKNTYQRGLVLDEIGAAEAKAGDVDAAVATAARADPHTMATLKAIGEHLGNSNDLPKAKSLVPKLKGGSSTVYAFIARCQAEKGKISEALLTAEQIAVPEVRRDALEWIAEQQGANGDYSGVRKTLALARTTHPTRRSAPEDVKVIIAMGQLSRGDVRAARRTIAMLKSSEMRFGAMISGAEALLKKADKLSATVWLDEALQGLPKGPSHDFLRYLAIPLQVKLAKNEGAIQAAGKLSPDLRVRGFTAVAVVCAEAKDIICVNAALRKIQSAGSCGDGYNEDFEVDLIILNVTAALIDHGQYEAASRFLTIVEEQLDDVSKMSIEPQIQLQRVFMLAQQDQFDSARSLAMKIRSDSISEIPRRTALRTIAVLDTKKNGVTSSRPWALTLTDSEDRAYALLGIAQALLEIDDLRLPYSVIQIH